MSTSKQNNVQKAKENAKKQAAKIATLKAGACFGKCDFTAKTCTSCLVFAVCAEKRESDKIKAATAKVKNTAKKAPAKKTVKLLTLSQVFFLAVSQQNTLFTMSDLLTSFMVLSEKLTAKKPSKKSSYGRSFSAHLKNALDGKEAVFSDRGFSFVEHDLYNYKVVKM